MPPYVSPGWNKTYPGIQILTVEEILDGAKIECPYRDGNVSTKAAKRAKEKSAEQIQIPGSPKEEAGHTKKEGGGTQWK